jgi:acyl dehydratase
VSEPGSDAQQHAVITDQMVEEARSMVGVWMRRDVHWPAQYEPVSQHDIRRWAMYSVGDDNPLWSDADYGKRTIWGGTIAPPSFLYTVDTLIVAPGLRGVQWIHGGTRWTLHRAVRPGDTIVARARVIRVQEKSGKRVARMLVQTGEILFTNQRQELVARAENDILRVPRARSGQGIRRQADEETRPPVRYSPEQIEEIRQAYLHEHRRGSQPLYWDEVQVGEQLPRIAKGPLNLVDLVGFYAGRRNVYNPLKLAFLERERHPANIYVSPATGIPTHPAAGHFDGEIAREVGMPAAYDNGWMRVNWIAHLLTNWAGDWGFVQQLDVRVPLPNYLGDLTWCHARVSGKEVAGSRHLVHLDCWGVNQRGEQTTVGRATVRLPSKSPDDRYFVEGDAPTDLPGSE